MKENKPQLEMKWRSILPTKKKPYIFIALSLKFNNNIEIVIIPSLSAHHQYIAYQHKIKHARELPALQAQMVSHKGTYKLKLLEEPVLDNHKYT
jgi:hypothetical protein